jgi:hypothetical protein
MATETKQPNTHITNIKGRFRVRSSAPTNPVAGDMYYNTTTNHLTYYTGSSWIGAPFT